MYQCAVMTIWGKLTSVLMRPGAVKEVDTTSSMAEMADDRKVTGKEGYTYDNLNIIWMG